MDAATKLIDTMKRDGIVPFRNRFSPEMVAQAHAEVEALCQAHLEKHRADPSAPTSPDDPLGDAINWKSVLYVVDIFGHAPTLEAMVEKMFTDSDTRGTLDRTLGKHYKIRGYNVRRMHGNYDPKTGGPFSIPHEWHRDWPGELTISMLLTDVPESDNSGTAMMPGSHLWPYCPRKGTLLSEQNVLRNFSTPWLPWVIRRLSFFTWLLGRTKLKGAIESTGKAGDFFFFVNDTWHGRMPNLHGRNTMVIFIGLFPTEFPFPDNVKIPAAHKIAKLPPRFRELLNHDQPVNTERDSLVHWMIAQQKPAAWHSLFGLVKLERAMVTHVVSAVERMSKIGTFFGSVKAKIRGALKPVVKPLLAKIRRRPSVPSTPTTVEETPLRKAG